MKIAVITSGFLPVPSVLGGAVELLTDFYLNENEKRGEHEFTVYSVYAEKTSVEAAKFKHCKFCFINTGSLWYRLRKKVFQKKHKCVAYDHHTEFFIHNVVQDLRRQHFDVVIVENKPGFVLHLTNATTAKIVLHLHNDHLNSTTPHAKEIFERCYKIITVSDYIKSRVATIAPSDKIITVHNGIDLEAFHNAKPIDRTTLGLSDTDFVLVFSGRLNLDKGIKELLEAMLLLQDKPDIKLLVLGGSFFGNETGDNDFVKRLKEIAAPLKERIIFAGHVPYKDLPNYLKLADVAVIPSVWEEPFGLTLVEAMAAGLPVVATKSGGIPEVVDNDSAILLTQGLNLPSFLKTEITELYQNAGLRKRLSAASIDRSMLFSHRTYSWNFLKSIIS